MQHSFPRRSSHLLPHLKQHHHHASSLSHQCMRSASYMSASQATDKHGNKKVLLKNLLAMKKRKEPITMITCYDTSQAKLADLANVDTVLVGDSCANVMLGLPNTNQITLDAIIHHTQAVTRGTQRAFVISDMPFGTYLTVTDAVRNAGRLIGEGGASCVKLEGYVPDSVRAISHFVPVCAHLGLLPQTTDCFGTRGRTHKDITQLAHQALKLQEAGASLLVLEKVCAETAAFISNLLSIPTIGIGSGPLCDGQVLVWHDLLGLHTPQTATYKFVKQYAKLAPSIVSSIERYVGEVKAQTFPSAAHSYFVPNTTWDKLLEDCDAALQERMEGVRNGCRNGGMRVVRSAAEMRRIRNGMDGGLESGKKVVFVPFLGGLHEGHLELVRAAKKVAEEEGDGEVWCSLFLNPMQFNEVADYAAYPYDMEEDLRLLREEGVGVVFAPEVRDVYPRYGDEDANEMSLFAAFVDFEGIMTDSDEGIQRPGHFKGVGTILTKLFAWLRPHKCVFGQKDFVQTIVVNNLCQEFFPDTHIIVHPTMRESDGLAMSSRNNKLSAEERTRAPLLYECLCVMASFVFDFLNANNSSDRIKDVIGVADVRRIGEEFCQAKGVELEYISFHDYSNGRKLQENDLSAFVRQHKVVISIAGSVGSSTRLIDNVVIGDEVQKKEDKSAVWEGIQYVPLSGVCIAPEHVH